MLHEHGTEPAVERCGCKQVSQRSPSHDGHISQRAGAGQHVDSTDGISAPDQHGHEAISGMAMGIKTQGCGMRRAGCVAVPHHASCDADRREPVGVATIGIRSATVSCLRRKASRAGVARER